MLTALDQIANQNHLQMVKAMLPYLPHSHQKMLSMVIKMQELQNVAKYFRQSPLQLKSCSAGQEPVHLPDMLSDIRNYCDENEKKMIDQISNLLSTLELYSVMAETMSPESFMSGGFPAGGFEAEMAPGDCSGNPESSAPQSANRKEESEPYES